MSNREQELRKLKEYIDNVEKETTLLLQSLQWDHKHLLECPAMVSCKYVAEHRIPLHSVEVHEKQCFLTQEGYNKNDVLLPDPIDPNADTIVKLSKQDIMRAINTAASLDSSFKRGAGTGAAEPLSVERLQHVYSADERRAIHDAVVAASPACHNLADLALKSSAAGAGGPPASKAKSRAEVLAELRDMKRRRARYRVAAKTANYSDVLRDVIKTQMELYAEAKGIFIKTEYGTKTYVSQNTSAAREHNTTNVVIKQERTSPDSDGSRHGETRKSTDRRRRRTEHQHRETASKETYEGSSDKRKYKDFSQDKYSKERRRYDEGHSKRDTYHKTKDTTNDGRNRRDNNKIEESSTSKHFRKYNENDRKEYKYDDRIYNNAPNNSSNYESSSKEHDKHRSYREDSSKNSKYDYRMKYDEYQSSHRDYNRSRDKSRRRYDAPIKEEKVDAYECTSDERKKRRIN